MQPSFHPGFNEPQFQGSTFPFGSRVQAASNANIASKPFKRPFSEANPGRRKHQQAALSQRIVEQKHNTQEMGYQGLGPVVEDSMGGLSATSNKEVEL